MLEIIGNILCAMLVLNGIDFIARAATHGTEKPLNFMLSILAGVAAIVAAFYFSIQVDDQASGARRAVDEIRQQAYEPLPEAVSPY